MVVPKAEKLVELWVVVLVDSMDDHLASQLAGW